MEYFALGRCKTFELLSWPLLLWSRRIRSVVLYALFTPHELELVSLEKKRKVGNKAESFDRSL